METRGRNGRVEKMGNKAMNCIAQGNKWKLALGRGGGAAAVHCTRSENNILSPPWALIAAGFLPASATPYKARTQFKISLTSIVLQQIMP
jgi:hypothetical protein